MSKSSEPFTWKNDIRQPSAGEPWRYPKPDTETPPNSESHYVTLPFVDIVTSSVHNSHGESRFQGIRIRILDKNEGPLPTGRADAVLPRYLEILHAWGLTTEVGEEGPPIERTAIWRDGEVLFHGRTHQSDSRYRGLHVITQGQLERVFVRDLLRHQVLVECCTALQEYTVSESPEDLDRPVRAVIRDNRGPLNLSLTERLTRGRQELDPSSKEAGGKVDANSITPQEVLEQANRIFTPYTVRFASPLTWLAIWKVIERVAEAFPSDNLRVHLADDAAHVHSVFGAFELNASILDASNLTWKLGYCARNLSPTSTLLPTYDSERHLHAANVVEISGKYLHYCCNCDIPAPQTHSLSKDLGAEAIQHAVRGEPLY
ncbi:hypothetical protein ASPACDRAFT_60656 [Aspergillus aculeatus ATCC 16872]|uniref:FAD-binding domain-containing protein n=1 Tax=Aspergillus aculeatus (strain ATCC 16872 / CBS 172.66 / WB 5094) TaxID=690307 RepID=A0A1L9WUE2_ASPA1|nr:uncharacterized protein ASPACDRAFT_60656 [Aspergillus aculeatus ATCC 16872]OJJ99830.1 hypothetical protein ASPACDRAFT_60656 [Aspergillus aculeatus ATCC 16872]